MEGKGGQWLILMIDFCAKLIINNYMMLLSEFLTQNYQVLEIGGGEGMEALAID